MKNNDEVRRADRKALPKFLLVVLVSIVLGLFLGMVGVFALKNFGPEGLTAVLKGLSRALGLAAPWLLLACVAVQTAVWLGWTRQARKLLDGWDGEDEAVSDRAETLLNKALNLSSLVAILSSFLMSALYAGEITPGEIAPRLFLGLGFFALELALSVLLQKRLVNLTKRLYPEKTPSALDPKFQKKWLADCDEAERAQIGDCAYHAYIATTNTCMVLWLISTLSALFLDTGLLCPFAVCLIWAVSLGTYNRRAIQLGRSGGAV